jgi:hypothetical protein
VNILQNRTFQIAAALAALMAMTRFNHFGSAVALPDASYAIFFLAGLFLGRGRGAGAVLLLLLAGGVLIDCYAINFQNVSAWCVTPAYGLLQLAYLALWLIGRRFAPHYSLSLRGISGLALITAVAGSVAFWIANVAFFLFAGYFDSMSLGEYISRVAGYHLSYVAVMLVYVGLAVGIHALFAGVKQRHSILTA